MILWQAVCQWVKAQSAIISYLVGPVDSVIVARTLCVASCDRRMSGGRLSLSRVRSVLFIFLLRIRGCWCWRGVVWPRAVRCGDAPSLPRVRSSGIAVTVAV